MAAKSDLSDVLAFIAAQQQSPTTACAYLGTDAAEIAADLAELDQPLSETLRVAVAGDGRICGVATVEWDAELGRSWVYGPWIADDVFANDATAGDEAALNLLHAVIEQTPADVTDHEMFASVENQRLARLAKNANWVDAGLSCALELETETPPWDYPPAPALLIREAIPHDLPTISALHDADFPGTYASASQLLDPDEDYRTLVAERDGLVVGYLTYQHQPISGEIAGQARNDGEQGRNDGEQGRNDGEQTCGDGELACGDGEQGRNDGEQACGGGEQACGGGEQERNDGESVYIDFVAVSADARRTGVGRALLATARAASADGRIRLTVDLPPESPTAAETHQAAIPFYLALGFKVTDTLRAYRSQ